MRSKREESVFNFSVSRNGANLFIGLIRDDRREKVIKVIMKKMRKRIMIRGKNIFIDISEALTNIMPVINRDVIIIFNRDDPISSTMHNSGEMEKFGISITFKKPFISRFLSPNSFRFSKPRI